MNILFVCTGNTCRSPMAEAILNSLAKENKLDVCAFSRGTSVFLGEDVNPKAKKSLKRIGIHDFEHISKQITEIDMESADLVLTMTASHKMMLKSIFPKYSSKIYTLSEKAYGKDKPISDPYGHDENVYDLCAQEIGDAIRKLIEKHEFSI